MRTRILIIISATAVGVAALVTTIAPASLTTQGDATTWKHKPVATTATIKPHSTTPAATAPVPPVSAVQTHPPVTVPATVVTIPPVPTTSTTVPAAPTPPTPVATPQITPAASGDYDHRWDRVNTCENGGSWTPLGSRYPNGLGLTAENWAAFGGGTDLSPSTQVAVAERFAAHYFYPGYIPDQQVCASW